MSHEVLKLSVVNCPSPSLALTNSVFLNPADCARLTLTVQAVALPLQTIGTIIGRSLRGNPNYPCRVASLPSPIPPAAFYAKPRFICLVSGLLPFGSIFIEVFFIFASIWSYKYYYVYGFLTSMLGRSGKGR